MGQCSRRKRQQNQNLKHGHGPQAGPRTATLPTGDPVIDFFSNFRLADLLGPPPEPEPAGQDDAQESGYSASRWNSYRDGRRAKVLFPLLYRRSSTS